MNQTLQTHFQSRQYMLSRDFELYYYNDRSLPKVEAHTHDYYEFYFLLEGNVSMQIEGREHPLKVGDLLIMPPDTQHHIHSFEGTSPYRRFVLWITVDCYHALLSRSIDYDYAVALSRETKMHVFHFTPIYFNTLIAKAFRLLEEQHANRFGKELKVELCFHDLLFYINRSVYEMHHSQISQEEKALSHNIMAFIEAHLSEDLTLDRLAGEFYVSKYHIAHLFREYFGFPIHQFILKKRLEACRNLLLTPVPITTTFSAYGFKDYSTFYRAFKKEYGMSPKEYRSLFADSNSIRLPSESARLLSEQQQGEDSE